MTPPLWSIRRSHGDTSPLVQWAAALGPCVYCLNCSNLTEFPARVKLPPNWVMAAVVSVSSAPRDESADTELSIASRPPHENYDPGADRDKCELDRRHTELEFGEVEEDSKSESECHRRVDEDLTSLSPEEIQSRLERTRREFYNRRKIIIKNLPSDVSNQVWLTLLTSFFKYLFCLYDWLIGQQCRLAKFSLALLLPLADQLKSAINFRRYKFWICLPMHSNLKSGVEF